MISTRTSLGLVHLILHDGTELPMTPLEATRLAIDLTLDAQAILSREKRTPDAVLNGERKDWTP